MHAIWCERRQLLKDRDVLTSIMPDPSCVLNAVLVVVAVAIVVKGGRFASPELAVALVLR
jgi:hypothetical protein